MRLRGRDDELLQRVAVERREQQITHADVELDRLGVRLARGRRDVPIFFDEQGTDEAPAEIRERQTLRLEIRVGVTEADDEIDERLIRRAPIDRERRDARTDDDREREEALADDFAERLEAADAFADALEPPVGAHGLERELLLASRHFRRSTTLSQAGHFNSVPTACSSPNTAPQ